MAGLTGRTPAEVFQTFKDEVQRLLNLTITDAPIRLVHVKGTTRAIMSSVDANGEGPAPLRSSDLFLYVAQHLVAERRGLLRPWRLRTVRYSYSIQERRDGNEPWVFRFEYISRGEQGSGLHCRHHLHIPRMLTVAGQELDLSRLHIPTGWVTIEELIRFLIHELGVHPRTNGWDKILQESEARFSEWTGREI